MHGSRSSATRRAIPHSVLSHKPPYWRVSPQSAARWQPGNSPLPVADLPVVFPIGLATQPPHHGLHASDAARKIPKVHSCRNRIRHTGFDLASALTRSLAIAMTTLPRAGRADRRRQRRLSASSKRSAKVSTGGHGKPCLLQRRDTIPWRPAHSTTASRITSCPGVA